MGPLAVAFIEAIIIPTLVGIGGGIITNDISDKIKSKNSQPTVGPPEDAYKNTKAAFAKAYLSNPKLTRDTMAPPGYDVTYKYSTGDAKNGIVYEYHFSDGSEYILYREMKIQDGKPQVSISKPVDPLKIREKALNYQKHGKAETDL